MMSKVPRTQTLQYQPLSSTIDSTATRQYVIMRAQPQHQCGDALQDTDNTVYFT